MNRTCSLVAPLVILASSGFHAARAAGAESKASNAWLSSYDKAMEQAKTDKKLVIADFAGSDWCPPCKALWSQILSKDEFVNAESPSAVLVEVDFPRKKEQDAAEKKRNQALEHEFKIEGFPTVIVFSSDGKEVGRIVGYSNKTAWASKFKAVLAKVK